MNGKLLAAVLAIVATLVASYAGWTTTSILRHAEQLRELEKISARQEAILEEVKTMLREIRDSQRLQLERSLQARPPR